MRNKYAWSPRGELVKDERKGRATEKMNIMAGLSEGTLVTLMMYECSMDYNLFNFWLEHQLLPEIQKNSLIVMDNASFYTSEKTKELVEFFSGCFFSRLIHLI